VSDFAVGYILGQNAEASARSLEQAAISFGRILDRRRQAAQEITELSWCHARIAQWEAWADMAIAEIQRLEADLAKSRKYAEWAGPEIERLKVEIARLPGRIAAATAETKRAAAADEVTRMLARSDDDLSF
jgi:phage shock protein A